MTSLRSLLWIVAVCALAVNFDRCRAGKGKNRGGDRTRSGNDKGRDREQSRVALPKFIFPTPSPTYEDVIVSVVRISKRVPLGAIFDSSVEGVLRIFQKSMSNYSEVDSVPSVNAYVDVINTADAYKLSRIMCRHFGRDAWMMYGSVSPDSFGFLHSISNSYSLPFITPWYTQKVRKKIDGLDYAISLRGDYHQAIIDTIKYYGWKKIVYVYDSDDGLMRLQQIFKTLPIYAPPFQITTVRRVINVNMLMSAIQELESGDRFGEKYVVLDCSITMVKFILVYHSVNDKNTKHTFHYFLTGLQLLDVAWSEKFVEARTVNVTGLSVIDKTAAASIDNRWNYDLMTGDEALALDAVKVLIDTVVRFKAEVSDTKMIINDVERIQCEPMNGSIYTSNRGSQLLDFIKQTDLNGVTGKVKFDEDGSRINFTLQVIEKQPNGQLAKIGNWYDYKGFVPVMPKMKRVTLPPSFDRNRTYTITTISEAPYYIEQKSEDYPRGGGVIRDGFCYDITVLIVQKLGIKYDIRLVRDKDYGTENSKIVGGWTGMMGEVVRKEADMAIAPLTVTPARERVVDFSQPFLSFDLRTFARSRLYNMSLFLRPLSGDVWLGIASCLPLVGVVLYIIARLSSYRWRSSTSFCQAIWFTLKSLLRQGSGSAPRFASGRVLGIVWWTFVFFVISCYTANLSSIITVLRMEDLLIRGSDKSCGGSYPVGLNLPPNDTVIKKIGWFRSFFLEAPADELAQRPCELVISDEEHGMKHFAVAVTKKSDLREAVNLALTSLKQEGEIQKLVKKWFPSGACRDEIIEEFSQSELRFSDMAGIFMILGGGLILAMIVAILEVLYKRRKQLAAAREKPVESLDGDIELEERPSPQHAATCSRSRLRWSDEAYPIDISDDIPELPESVTMS